MSAVPVPVIVGSVMIVAGVILGAYITISVLKNRRSNRENDLFD